MTLTCVDDGVPSETIEALHRAATLREVGFEHVDARRFDYTTATPLEPGALLYRPAVSAGAMRVEQFLLAPDVVTFYRTPDAHCFHPPSPTLLFAQRGLPVPRTVPAARPDRTLLRRSVDWLGGLPLVLKMPGGEGGVGVMRVDSLPSLFSVVDYLHSLGCAPALMPFIADAVHWRVIVVGDDAIAAYSNPIETDDFRSLAGAGAAAGTARVAPELAALAVAASQAVRTYFAGVDILEHTSGRLYLLEANFPCYFAQAQACTGVDVAGAMVAFLVRQVPASARAVR